MSDFISGLSFDRAKKAVVSNTTASSVLTVMLVASFAAMVTSAYSADHTRKSSAWGSADEKLKSAYKLSVQTSILSGLISLASIGGLAFIVLKK